MKEILQEFDYANCSEYLLNRKIASELDFIKSKENERLFIELSNDILESIDHGFILFKKYFDIKVSYEDFRKNKIKVNNQTFKLFKYIFQNKEIVEEYGEDKLKAISEEIGKYKFSNETLYLCLSTNINDILLASTSNNWTSCINLINGDFKRTIFGNLFNQGIFIIYITDLKKKQYKNIESYNMLLRSFGFVDEESNLISTLYYPTRTNFDINLKDLKISYPRKEIKSKYCFDLIRNEKNAFVFPYIDKGRIIKVGNDYSFVTGSSQDRYIANVLVDDELVKFENYFYYGSNRNIVKKHCDICFSESGIITTINETNYCKTCLPNHKEICYKCGKETSCNLTDGNDYICKDCLTEEDNSCPICGTIFPKTRMHTCKFCRSKYKDAYNKYMYYNKIKNNTYTYWKHLLLKDGDIEEKDDNIAWDDTQGIYIKI